MCGIICYFGQTQGVNRILDALQLLEYKAPDSSGIAIIDEFGNYSVRRSAGNARQLVEKISANPLYPSSNSHDPVRHAFRLVGTHIASRTSLLPGVRERGRLESEPVHRSQNTTEVIVFEWERAAKQIRDNELNGESARFIDQLKVWEVDDPEENALRLTLQQLRSGNVHACAFHSRRNPGVLYVSSHNKPIAIIIREVCEGTGDQRHEIMVASDVNAALALWSREQVEAARWSSA